MRISDWSSDVCSSDLQPPQAALLGVEPQQRRLRRLVGAMEVAGPAERAADVAQTLALRLQAAAVGATHRLDARDRTGVGQGKSVSVSVDLGGRRTIKKQNRDIHHTVSNKHK